MEKQKGRNKYSGKDKTLEVLIIPFLQEIKELSQPPLTHLLPFYKVG